MRFQKFYVPVCFQGVYNMNFIQFLSKNNMHPVEMQLKLLELIP